MASAQDLRAEVADALADEGMTPVPPGSRLTRALNRAKNDVVTLLADLDPSILAVRLDYTVVAGDASITLPIAPPVHQVLGLSVVQTDYEYEVPIHDRRDPGEIDLSRTAFWMYPENDKLFFSPATGAPEALTLRLRYVATSADLTEDGLGSAYDNIPAEWTDLIVLQAVLDLLPGGFKARQKYVARLAERKNSLLIGMARRINQRPMRVRPTRDVGEDYTYLEP
jgi:hypothetical protein